MPEFLQINLQTARRLILASQDLFPPRSLNGKDGALSYLDKVRSIQFDPINVVGRNPDLVLQSRVKDFQPAMLNDLLYQDRLLFDSWDKMASLSLADDWPFFAPLRSRMEGIFGVPPEVVMSLAPEVIKQIEDEGPQCSLDFELNDKTDWAWGPARVTRASLESLFRMGKLGVHHRVNNRRYFDLIENLLPGELLEETDPHQDLREYQRWHILRRVRSIGLVHANAGEHWGGMIGIKSPLRRQILTELVEDDSLYEVEIEEIPGEIFYVPSELLSLINQQQRSTPEPQAAFLAPLDNLLWDRKNLSRLFQFDYMWEVYKPKKDRRYGYYVLPVLFKDGFIGRFDPAFDKKKRVLTIQNWWWEDDYQPNPKAEEALINCMMDFLSYLNADELQVPKTILKNGGLDWLEDFS
jgi:uncharacterized protein YcaQ